MYFLYSFQLNLLYRKYIPSQMMSDGYFKACNICHSSCLTRIEPSRRGNGLMMIIASFPFLVLKWQNTQILSQKSYKPWNTCGRVFLSIFTAGNYTQKHSSTEVMPDRYFKAWVRFDNKVLNCTHQMFHGTNYRVAVRILRNIFDLLLSSFNDFQSNFAKFPVVFTCFLNFANQSNIYNSNPVFTLKF